MFIKNIDDKENIGEGFSNKLTLIFVICDEFTVAGRQADRLCQKITYLARSIILNVSDNTYCVIDRRINLLLQWSFSTSGNLITFNRKQSYPVETVAKICSFF